MFGLSEKDKKTAAAVLASAQTDEMAQQVMLEVDDDVIKSEAGVKAVIQKMGQ